MAMADDLDLSIVSVSWNSRDDLRICMPSVARSAASIRFEHIVADNASSDGSADFVERNYPDAIVIRNTGNLGFSRANNAAVSRCRGKYVLFLNSDTEVLDDALPRMVAAMDRDPTIGILGPKLLDADRRWSRDMGDRLPTLWTLANTYLGLSRLPPASLFPGIVRNQDFDKAEEVGWVCGAGLMVRREILERDLWHEDVFFFGEDLEYCARVARRGYRICAIPDAEIIHYSGRSMAKQSVEFLSGKASGIAVYLREVHGPLMAWAGVRIIWLGYWLRSTRCRLAYRFGGGSSSLQKNQRLQQYLHLDREGSRDKA
jgi:GT2 family glycosyltransferase